MGEYTGTITQKGQVTIPSVVRAYLRLNVSDKIAFEVRNGIVVLRKPNQLKLEDVFGAVSPQERPEDFKIMRDSAIEEHIAEVRSNES